MTTTFRFTTCEGTEITTNSWNLQPVSFPTTICESLAIGDPVTYSGSAQTLDILNTTYKVELNRSASNDWYISIDNSSSATASANIISGQYSTGSLCTVTMNLIDHVRKPSAVRTVEFNTIFKNVGWNDYFVLQDGLVKTTDVSGTLTVDLIPGYYNVVFKGEKKRTLFTILVPNDSTANAKDIVVTDRLVAETISVKNEANYGYTAQTADARFVGIGELVGSSSYALTASYAVNSANLPDFVYTSTILHNNTMSVYDVAQHTWYDVLSMILWNKGYLVFTTSSYTGSVYTSATIDTASYVATSSYPFTIYGSNIGYIGGNVGIGTTTPSQKLEVAGNISCSVITASINNNGYVMPVMQAGQLYFDGEITKPVMFSKPMPSENYSIAFGCALSGAYAPGWWGKSFTGFTASFTDTTIAYVDWAVVGWTQ